MQFLRVLSLVVVAAGASPQRTSGPELLTVRGVVDGNTLDVANYGRIRLARVKAPKAGRRGGLDGEPFGREARERLETLVAHRLVRLEFPSAASFTSAYVLLDDGSFVNALLVGDGLAIVSGRPAGARGEQLVRAQTRAQQLRLGIWAPRLVAQRDQRID